MPGTWVETRELWTNRSHGFSLPVEVKYRRRFQVQVDDIRFNPEDIRNPLIVGNIPAILDPHPNDARALCLSHEIEQNDENPFIFDVTADYKSVGFGSVLEPDQAAENPLDRPVEIEGDFQQFRRIVWKDKFGVDILNSAKDAFNPPVEADDSRPTITLTKNKASLSYPIVLAYRDAINTDTFLGFAPYTLKIMAISWRRAFENNVTYFVQRVTVQANPETWWFLILDRGFNKTNSGGTKVAITQTDGVRPSEPVLLDGAGNILNETGGNAPPYFHIKRVYPELPFAALGMT